jgi:hypothetical protein
MISKHVVFIFAGLALAGCCASGTTCDVPTAGAHAAWDGLGPDLNDNANGNTNAHPAKSSRPREASMRIDSNVSGERKRQANNEWEQQQAADKADEARLSKTMIICRGCSLPPAHAEDNSGSITANR